MHEGSSIRTTSKQTLRQVSERPSEMPRNAPPASTPGSTLHQSSGSTRAPRDPLEHVAHYRSQGWRMDLDLIFKAYYKYNFSSFKESEWSKLRDKVLDHLLPCQDEWRSIKENDPLQYMPYMEEQFYAATRIRLKGLAKCTRWIKQGSYYHSVVAKKGQLCKCPHLAGIELPRAPQITPSESCWASQKKAEAPVASSSAPIIEASAPQGATSNAPAPMEMGEQAMANPGWNRLRLKTTSRETGPQNIAGHNQGGRKTDQHFPSHSRMMRKDAPPPRSSTGMQDSSHRPITMWPPWE